LRSPACVTIPTPAICMAEAGWAHAPAHGDDDLTRTQLKNNLPTRPLISVASLCLIPMALHAQTAGTPPPIDPSQPASQASSPSQPGAPSLPSQPSQPAGIPQTMGTSFPSGGYQPVGSQGSSVATEGEPTLRLRAMAGIEHETNPLRLSQSSGSDQVGILGVGLKFDKRYGLQRLRADVEANTYKYQDNSDLDYSTVNYALAWDWQFTPRFHGVLSADRRQYREVNTDPVALVNRVGKRTERTEVAEGIYELGAAVRLLAGVSHSSADSSVGTSWDASPSVRSARVGVGYELPSGASIYARFRRGDGDYTAATVGSAFGDFREKESDVVVKWPLTGKTSLEARLGHLERNHSSAPQLDFSGMVGNAGVNWNITGKTRLAAGFSRDLTASGLATGGHVQSNRFYIGPVWNATAQVAVNARYDRVRREWKGISPGAGDFGRHETIQAVSAGVDWEPRRWLTLTTYVRNERLKSTTLNAGYRSTTIGLAGKAYF
jgi:exopolysaccharide biosynthesis operon protein EpsL